MIKVRRPLIPAFLCIALLLGACRLPATYTPTPGLDEPVFTSAAETIEAQLTDMVGFATQTAFAAEAGAAQATAGKGAAIETLPATSTPRPTKTPLPSNTPIPTATLESTLAPSPTEIPEDPKERLGKPTWQDTFENAMNWPLYYDEHVEMQISGGQLQMKALYADKWDSWMLTQQYPTDFYIEAEATPGECGYLDRYGLMVRAPSANQAYQYGFTCDGKYSLRVWTGEKYYYPVQWTINRHILMGPDQTNRLGLLVEGNKFSLYANGKFLTAIKDDTYSEGGIGLFVGAVKTAGFTAYFDKIAYWELPEE